MLTERQRRTRRLAVAVIVAVLLAQSFAAEPSTKIKCVVTAYCSCKKCCGPNAKGITASGKRVKPGMVAADWRIFPRGTVLYIPGYGRCTVEDKGGAIRGNRLDVYYPTHKAALCWGRKTVEVQVIRYGKR